MHPENINMLLYMAKPSVTLLYLRNANNLDEEIDMLRFTPQDEIHHPEGDAFTHTSLVLDMAAEIAIRENLNAFDNAVLRLAALCHDMGKVTHTQVNSDGKITAYGHPLAGVLPATKFLTRAKINKTVIENVLPLVEHHMAWVGFYTPDVTSKAVRKIVKSIQPATIQMLGYIVEADMSGRGGEYYRQGLPKRMKDILTVAATLDNPVDVYPEPLIDGNTIMELTGIAPSPLLGKIKAAMYKAQLEGKFTTLEQGIMILLHHVVIAEK